MRATCGLLVVLFLIAGCGGSSGGGSTPVATDPFSGTYGYVGFIGSEMSALANGWKRLFEGEKDPHFVYTLPSKDLAKSVSKPKDIKGDSTAHEIAEWGKADDELIEAVMKAVY